MLSEKSIIRNTYWSIIPADWKKFPVYRTKHRTVYKFVKSVGYFVQHGGWLQKFKQFDLRVNHSLIYVGKKQSKGLNYDMKNFI